MPKVLICSLRPWSLQNIQPVIDINPDIEWNIFDYTQPLPDNLDAIDLIITCEPHDRHWFSFYPNARKTGKPIIAVQQSLFYSSITGIDTEEYYDYYLLWGEQMFDFCLRNKNTPRKLVVTGCPFFDKMFNIQTEDHGYTLGLEGGDSGEGLDYLKKIPNTIVVPHPNKTDYKLTYNTLELIRCAHKVIVHSTGCGIWAIIMKKSCEILGTNERYLHWQDPNFDFIKWAVTDNLATKRVDHFIRCLL